MDEGEPVRTGKANVFLHSFVAGAIAGAVAKTMIAPLDRTKINFQISPDKQYSFRGALRFIRKSIRQEGITSLWRGNSATMARIIPYAAIQYSSHEQWKSFLREYMSGSQNVQRYVAGSLAGLTASTLTYPLDMVRARMACTERDRYKSLIEVFKKIYHTEGLKVLYRGYTPTIIGVIPYAGTSFYTYESLKDLHKDRAVYPLERLLFGALAGLLGQTSSYPFDIVRRRMQTAGVTGSDELYSTVWKSLLHIAKSEGVVKGLYKGLSMNWIKGPLAVGVSFTTYDVIQNIFENKWPQ